MPIKPLLSYVMLPAIVLILSYPRHAPAQDEGLVLQGGGTAFIVGTQGTAITINSNVAECDAIHAKRQAWVVKASIIARDTTNNLALLQFDSNISGNIAIRTDPPLRLGDQVVTFGFPLGRTLAADGSLSMGIIGALAGLANNENFFQISAPIQRGNSGGALLDLSGNLIGIVFGSLIPPKDAAATTDILQNINFAIKVPIVRAFLDANRVSYKTATSSSHREVGDIADQAKDFTVLIECLKRNRQANNIQPSSDAVRFQSAQNARLYEESPADPQGKAYPGVARWLTEGASRPGLSPVTTVRAEIEIPQRQLTIRWSLAPNDDRSLAASHTMEISFAVPPEFVHGGVLNVPGILMKSMEGQRGVPLSGRSVKVRSNTFVVGLSQVERDMHQNIQTLKDKSWFDIPIVYNDGSRAILAIEKGPAGDRAFADAFAAWKQ